MNFFPAQNWLSPADFLPFSSLELFFKAEDYEIRKSKLKWLYDLVSILIIENRLLTNQPPKNVPSFILRYAFLGTLFVRSTLFVIISAGLLIM